MSEVEKLEEELKQIKSKSKSSILSVIRDTMNLGISEFSKTVSTIFSAPKSGKNQISKQMEDWESGVVTSRSYKI